MKALRIIVGWIVSLAVPIVLLMTAVRLLISPAFLQIEYHTPNFPPDSYGFTLEDRLHWSRLAVDYLVNDQGINFLGDLKFDNGQPLYNERELSHMLDVKILVQKTIIAWYLLLVFVIVTGLVAWRTHLLSDYWFAVSRGGWLTIGMVLAILAAVAISFETLFTDFHRLFFTGDTWLFLYSDTLIRLFPMRFWRDGFIGVGGFTILGALTAAFLGKRWSRTPSSL
jgi:integral membrane protein (TIGR01906 family)